MELSEFEKIVPNAQFEGITWITPNQQTAWRVQTLLTKEPCTIKWIQGMKPGEVFFDVGANMGGYSLYAAKQGLQVHAFEPEAQNFALLVRNLAINPLLASNITAWPVALSDHLSMEILHLSSMFPGSSCHAYGESINYQGKQKDFPFRQGSISTTLDHFCAKYGYPDHIKIDVDGFEHKVIKGGEQAVKHAKSVLIEINRNYPEHVELIDYMTNRRGFNYDAAQAEESRRKEGPFTDVGNIIFVRD